MAVYGQGMVSHRKPRPTGSPTAAGGAVLASPNLGVGWATFGQALPQGACPSGMVPAVQGLASQADVKTRWPDGSVKFAVVTAKVTSGGTYNLVSASPAAGSFVPAVPAASVTFQVRHRMALLGEFLVNSGTCTVRLTHPGGSVRVTADAVRLVPAAGGAAQVVRVADAGFAKTGAWTTWSAPTYNYGHFGTGGVAYSDTGGDTCTWTFAGLAPGLYRVSMGWPGFTTLDNGAPSVRGSPAVAVGVFDGTTGGTSRGAVTVNQGSVAGNTACAAHELVGRVLGTYTITGATLTVVVDDFAATATDGYTVADAVGVFKTDGSHAQVIDDGAAALAGSWSSGSGQGDYRGYGGDYKYAGNFTGTTPFGPDNWATGTGSNSATYSFAGLTAGTYAVVAWQPFSQADTISGLPGNGGSTKGAACFATNARWKVYNGTAIPGNLLATLTVKQRGWGDSSREVSGYSDPCGEYNDVRTYVAAMPASPTADKWLDGPNVLEYRAYVNPACSSPAETHPFLLVVFDCRVYADGAARVTVAVENTYNKPVAGPVYYDCQAAVNGVTVFDPGAVNNPLGVEQFWATRWAKRLNVPGLAESQVSPDWAPAFKAKAVPHYVATTDSDWTNPAAVNGAGTGGSYLNILCRGGIDVGDMRQTGDHPFIGPHPGWCVQYIAHGPTHSSFNYMRATDETGEGPWPVHLRESDNSLVSVFNRTTMWLDARGQSPSDPNCMQGDYYSYASVHTPRYFLEPQISHHPQFGVVNYLATGDRHALDAAQFWANASVLFFNNLERQAADANNVPQLATGQAGMLTFEHRAMAWGLRSLAEAAGLTPDGDAATKNYFSTLAENTLAFHDGYARGAYFWNGTKHHFGSPLGIQYDLYSGDFDQHTPGSPPWASGNESFTSVLTPFWQDAFLTYAVFLCRARGLPRSGGADGRLFSANWYEYAINVLSNYNPANHDDFSGTYWPVHVNYNLPTNSHLQLWCDDQADTPQNWTYAAGAPGTHWVKLSAADSYTSYFALSCVSDGATLAAVHLEFNKSTSTLAGQGGCPYPLNRDDNRNDIGATPYAFLVWLKAPAALSQGALRAAFVDGAGNEVGSGMTTFDLTTVGTTYTRYVCTLTTPATASLPNPCRLRLKLTTAPPGGKALHISNVCLYSLTGTWLAEPYEANAARTDVNLSGATAVWTYFTTWDQAFSDSVARTDHYDSVYNGSITLPGYQVPYPHLHAQMCNLSAYDGHRPADALAVNNLIRAESYFAARMQDQWNFGWGVYY